MSLLPPHAIDEFQALWKNHYGTELSREEATQRAHQVFTMVRMIVQTPPSCAQAFTDSDETERVAEQEQEEGRT